MVKCFDKFFKEKLLLISLRNHLKNFFLKVLFLDSIIKYCRNTDRFHKAIVQLIEKLKSSFHLFLKIVPLELCSNSSTFLLILLKIK